MIVKSSKSLVVSTNLFSFSPFLQICMLDHPQNNIKISICRGLFKRNILFYENISQMCVGHITPMSVFWEKPLCAQADRK